MLSQELRDRHNVVALLVAAVSLGSLALHGASGPAQGPGVPVSILLAPGQKEPLRWQGIAFGNELKSALEQLKINNPLWQKNPP